MFGFFKKKVISFEDQLETLGELGFTLNSDINPDSLFEEFTRNEYEKVPYELLLTSLGGEICRGDKCFVISDAVWHLDTECIEDHGDYKAIIERLSKMTGHAIQNIKDFVDIESEKAWTSFEFNQKPVKWDLKIDNDWLDSEIVLHYNQLTGDTSSKRIVTSVLGQDCLVAYLDDEQLKEINKLVNHKFI